MVDLHKNISSYTDTMIKKEKVLVALFGIIFLGLVKTQASVLTGVEPTYINVGSGSDLSYLVIDESDLYTTPLVFVYHYDYDSNNPLTGFSLLTNVAAGSALVPSTSFYDGGLGNSLDSLTYAGGATVTGTNATEFSVGTYWAYYLSGGLDGGVIPDLMGQWNYANYGMDSRTVTPGSWDGWTLSSFTSDYTTYNFLPSLDVAAVPEPHTTYLVLLSLVSVFFLNRWRQWKWVLIHE